jgi:hypothetical protein
MAEQILSCSLYAYAFNRNDGRSNGIGYILQFVGRLLQPSTSDMAALYVGPLVTKIISKVTNAPPRLSSILQFKTVKAFRLMYLHTDPHLQLGGQLGAGTLTDMLKAVLARLQTQCMPSLAQVRSNSPIPGPPGPRI